MKPARISVIGAGYVGLVTGACFASRGHRVVLVDKDKSKIAVLKRRKSPIYEPGLDEILKTTPVEVTGSIGRALADSDICFVCVSTGSDGSNGGIELKQVKEVSEAIGKALTRKILLVIKSTVIPGTTDSVIIPLLEKEGKKPGRDFDICVNPEFLREGKAVTDFLNPDRIIIGENKSGDGAPLTQLYEGFNCPILHFNLKTAEMIKYASNIFLAMKLSYINEIGNIGKILDIDVYQVARGMGYDPRIGAAFLRAGIGFGGSCLPKDLKAMISMSEEIGYKPRLLKEIWRLNEEQPLKMIQLLKKYVPDLRGQEIGILGLAFKPDTDDIRDSRAIKITASLLEEGAVVKACDPKAMKNFARLFPQVQYVAPSEVLGCRAVLILTEWEEFNHLDYRHCTVIDGRMVEKAKEAKIYEGICW